MHPNIRLLFLNVVIGGFLAVCEKLLTIAYVSAILFARNGRAFPVSAASCVGFKIVALFGFGLRSCSFLAIGLDRWKASRQRDLRYLLE